MNKLILTLAHGEPYERMLEITYPYMHKYGLKHGYTVSKVNPNVIIDKDRHPSWWKLEAILRGALCSADIILWLDADVLIIDNTHDIANELENHITGLVVHENQVHGRVPNCGVWLLRKEFVPYILKMSREDNYPTSNRIWEQAALIKIMNGTINFPIKLPETKPFPWKELSQEWNHTQQTKNTRFFHATGSKNLEDRINSLNRGIQNENNL